MVFSFAAVSVSAETSELPATGIIYLNEMRDDTVYKLYKVFDLASVSADGTAFSYVIDLRKDSQEKYVDPWANFIMSDATAKTYLSVDENGAISKTAAFTGDEATILLAKAAIAYANDSRNGVTPFVTSELPAGQTSKTNFEKTAEGGTFKDLPAGYYLFESAVGTLGALVTARPNAPAYINVKNKAPIVEKTVLEDSVNEWLANNSVDIGQEIFFRATINAQAGAENYAFHDTMSGMELWQENGNYKISIVHSKNIYNAALGETKEDTLVAGTDYTLLINPHAGVTFGIKFSQGFCDKIKANDKIIISYSAKLTDKATIAGEGNTNICWLGYGAMNGDEPSFRTATSTTYTHTYGVDVVKTTNNSASLPGAEFNLYPALADGTIDESNPVKFTYNATEQVYYVDPNGSQDFVAGNKTMTTTTTDGEVLTGEFAVATLIGLDNGTYYLRETVAPAGYNALTEDKVFTISGSNMKAGFVVSQVTETGEGGATTTKNVTKYTAGGIHIENQKGDKLPETGGMGTTLFVTFGTIVALGAGILLVTKKRMAMIED